MDTTKLSAKGQVVLPKKKSHGVAELAGMLRRKGRKKVSLETMADAIESELESRRARRRY
jgi:hypothetical protein